MKASPVRPGDFIELFAEIDLLVALSACPGRDCGASHSDDIANATCSRWRSIGRARERWPAGSHHRRQIFSLAWSPVKRQRRLISGWFELNEGRFGSSASCKLRFLPTGRRECIEKLTFAYSFRGKPVRHPGHASHQPRRMTMETPAQTTSATPRREPWNKGKLIGQKPPLRPKHVWSIRA